MSQAHPDDILIVGRMDEAREYRMFPPSRIFSTSRADRLEGRIFRIAWCTPLAVESQQWDVAEKILWRIERTGHGRVRPISEWVPATALWDLIDELPYSSIPTAQDAHNVLAWVSNHITGANLPERNASKSRDFGRGYAKAIQDVLALLASVYEGV